MQYFCSKIFAFLSIFLFFLSCSSSSPCQPYYGVGIKDSSIRYHDNITTWEGCAMLCADHRKCQAWSWQHPNSPKKPQRCWFKSAAQELVRNVHAISGPAACTQSDMCGQEIAEGAGKPSVVLTATKTGKKKRRKINGKKHKNGRRYNKGK
eukprot:TRINITY_DN40435_c0_g1_i1.p1 TRINITY_DN40435_c0_g1~~TRINITY_DN40435_c0_g1_i1.p1  ORF type:complete len:151 (-),score=37.86 TRINITY_DN40435_c0_g1_i1:31-483(-)